MGRSPATDAEIADLYRQRYAVFERVATAVLGDRDGARDAVQDGFATALRRRRSFRGDGSLEAWVWRIVLNAARSAARKRSATPTGLHPHANGRYDDPALAELSVHLGLLPERQRLIVFLRYFADLDYAAIAEALEISSGTVAATLNQAHRALRKRIEKELA
jgi:RNA polymerase sigma factor (sigma-70 family)